MQTTNTTQPIVVTLDAGGTNFVFAAMQNGSMIGERITLPSSAHDLDKCLQTLIDGFSQIISSLPEKPAAISFAFLALPTTAMALSAVTYQTSHRSAMA